MKIFHVTEVTGRFSDWDKIPKDTLENACRRGSAVHLACTSHVNFGYCLSLPDEWQGYYDSFCNWYEQNVWRTFFVEERIVDEVFGFTGMLDFLFALHGGEIVLTDIKTPLAESKTWKAQLAAYGYLLREVKKFRFDDMMSLRLNPNGNGAKGVRYGGHESEYFSYFLSGLNACRGLMG